MERNLDSDNWWLALSDRYKSRGNLPNPWQERKVTNLHQQLAKCMGVGAPVPFP